jgi:hypothetical protein
LDNQQNQLSPLKRAKIEIRPSTIHRYGVFAKETLAVKEIIEECPVINFTGYNTALWNYVFHWDEQQSALALGCGSMFNHSDTPNTAYHIDKPRGIMVFTAARSIQKDEEILVDYGKNWFASRQEKLLTQQKLKTRRRFLRLAFISLLLIFMAMGSTLLGTKFKSKPSIFPVRFAQVLNSALQTQYLNRWESSSMALRK